MWRDQKDHNQNKKNVIKVDLKKTKFKFFGSLFRIMLCIVEVNKTFILMNQAAFSVWNEELFEYLPDTWKVHGLIFIFSTAFLLQKLMHPYILAQEQMTTVNFVFQMRTPIFEIKQIHSLRFTGFFGLFLNKFP